MRVRHEAKIVRADQIPFVARGITDTIKELHWFAKYLTASQSAVESGQLYHQRGLLPIRHCNGKYVTRKDFLSTVKTWINDAKENKDKDP
eukprot:3911-Eustigmatos_ZCMA.PRE.1